MVSLSSDTNDNTTVFVFVVVFVSSKWFGWTLLLTNILSLSITQNCLYSETFEQLAGHRVHSSNRNATAIYILYCMHAILVHTLSVNILSILLFFLPSLLCTKFYMKNITSDVYYFNPVNECRYHFLDSILLFVVCLFICLLVCLCTTKLLVRFRVIAWRALIYGVDKFFFLLSSFHRHWMFCFSSFFPLNFYFYLLVAWSL